METIAASLQQLTAVMTAHRAGSKKVFLHQQTPTALTQLAYGELNQNEHIEHHTHPSMEEYFFFIEGDGIFEIGDHTIELNNDVFVRVPAGISHALRCYGQQLRFVYFGISLPGQSD